MAERHGEIIMSSIVWTTVEAVNEGPARTIASTPKAFGATRRLNRFRRGGLVPFGVLGASPRREVRYPILAGGMEEPTGELAGMR